MLKSFYPTIGLEIHIELKTSSKMFCSCKNDAEEKSANVNICPVCTAQPGTLPVINKEAVKKVIKTGIALNCKIQKDTYFERKNYFYPDLPKNYQISQYLAPLCAGGFLEIPLNEKRERRKIRIKRVHLEEDAGKLIHPEGASYSLVDFNRAGVPLMELVTEPDIASAAEAKKFVKELQLVLRYLDVSDADMEKGQMRVEVNISLAGEKGGLGTKVEIKNLNSLKSMEKAIEYEIKRQGELLGRGEKVIQETRGWHDKKEITFSQRIKEESHDYRYFPEPDLSPLKIEDEFLIEAKKEIPELPQERRKRFVKEYYFSEKEADIYVTQKNLGEYFEKVISELRNWVKEKKFKKEVNEQEFKELIKLASNYITTDLQFLIKETQNVDYDNFPITAENFAEFVSMIYLGEISSKIAKTLLREMFKTKKDPSQIMEEKGLKMISGEEELKELAKKVIKENEKAVNDYKKGKEAALQYLIGQVMALSRGRAEPSAVKDILKKLL
jgi:aspartyl-tRNA(Asn)/glutamyl-tRNA(Gln) amidotransferase subunit B